MAQWLETLDACAEDPAPAWCLTTTLNSGSKGTRGTRYEHAHTHMQGQHSNTWNLKTDAFEEKANTTVSLTPSTDFLELMNQSRSC